ncbi:MAG: hypothetical protein ACK4OE_16185 [Acidovorax sp.]|uniref:hypothetical protein n=1 Tax=Acidovorax sp. TaxID=1872122 RepID=UPI00391D9F63
MSTVTTEVKPKAETRTLIWGALMDLRAQGQIATRQVVAQVTGLKLVTVDDHLTRMVEDGDLRRPVAGVVEIVEKLPPPRAVSMTHSPEGPSKLEIGDTCIDIWPQERRMLANLLLGDAVQYSNIQTGQDLNLLAHQVWGDLKQLKRDLGG